MIYGSGVRKQIQERSVAIVGVNISSIGVVNISLKHRFLFTMPAAVIFMQM